MLEADQDRYEAHYAEKLWRLLPEIYRALDAEVPDQKGPLRELVERIGKQVAVVRRSIDRAWEDQSIESCDDWVIPYIGDLLGTRLVESLDARGKRLDVAKTIHYRRRKGTLAVLEELSADITGWEARAVEMFRRMGRARHGLDFEIGWPGSAAYGPVTRTPVYGIAHLGSPHLQALVGTAFDELSYTVDVRRGKGRSGWYNTPRLGVFVSRLHAYPVEGATPVAHATCPNVLSFDPTGRRIQLFASSTRAHGDDWVAPKEHELGGPISRSLFRRAYDGLWATIDAANSGSILPRSLGVYLDHNGDRTLIEAGDVSSDPALHETRHYVDPEEGLFYVAKGPDAPIPTAYSMAYHHGFSSNIGAGTFDRRRVGAPAPTAPEIMGGGGALDAALGAASGAGVLSIGDSRTYDSVSDLSVSDLTLRAKSGQRPLVRLPEGANGPTVWTIEGGLPEGASRLTIDGLFVSGGEIVLAGELDSVTLTTCTLDPGSEKNPPSGQLYELAVDGRPLLPCRLRIRAKIRRLVIDRCVTGPIVVEGLGAVESLSITDSVVQSLHGDMAIDAPAPSVVAIDRSTILGPIRVHRLEASSTILDEPALVTDAQHSCVRTSAWASGSKLPKKFESFTLPPKAPLFTSRRFGDPGYAQLSRAAPARLFDGGEGGSEIGAFSREKNAIKERSLLQKLHEHMPVGLTPVLIHTT